MVNVKKVCALLCVFAVVTNHTAVYDNRFFPLFARPYLTYDDRCSYVQSNAMFMFADAAFDDNERNVTISSLFARRPGGGPDAWDPDAHLPGDRPSAFDLNQLGDAMTIAGLVNPLKTEWRGQKIEYHIVSKFQTQGADITMRHFFTDWLSVGLEWYFMRLHSRHDFVLGQTSLVPRDQNLSEGDQIELDQTRRAMFEEIGLTNCFCSAFGSGDLDLYVRFGQRFDHKFKMRTLDLGWAIGFLLPTGKKQSIASAASMPFGGNGLFGMYGQFDLELEVKEDWKFGFFSRLSKRFDKTQERRVPVANEHPLFGATVGNMHIDPGFTFTIVPYICFENLREGFGARILYYIRHHEGDIWQDARCDQRVPVNLTTMNGAYGVTESRSEWSAEHLSLNAFYDFGKTKVCRGYEPIISLAWDIPVVYSATENVPKTQRVSVGVEINF